MLVEDGDAAALGRAAAVMIGEAERWRRAGLERARAFSWRKAAKQTIAAYESVLKKGS
jgi:glycosyltransferase involved in cell wall biosynthesis